MKYLWIVMAFSILLGLVTSARAVQYVTGPSIWIDVKASSQKTAPGIPVRLSVTFGDKDYIVADNGIIQQIIDDPVKLTWDTSGGQISKWSLGDNQPYDLSFTALQPGYYAICFTATDSGKYAPDPPKRVVIEINVQQNNAALAPTVRVGANPQTISLDRHRSSTITAQVLGDDIAGKEVRFFATAGTLSAAKAVTDANGLVSVQLTATRADIGTATVIAYYANSETSTTVQITDRVPYARPPDPIPGPPAFPTYQPAFLISVDPQTLPADGQSTAGVTIRLVDGLGRGLFRQIVDFSATAGVIRPLRALTDINGYAQVQLVAAAVPGQALIFAQSGAQRSYTVVTFAPLQPKPIGPPRLFLTVDPTAAPADGTAKVLVAVLALDSNGFAVPGIPIDFSSSLGTVQYPRVTTNDAGQAATYVFAPKKPGVAAVTARYNDLTAASQVTFQGSPDADTGLDIRSWNEQQMVYAAERWYYRVINSPNSSMRALAILDENGKVAKQIDLGKNSLLIRDQYGAAHGYGTEDGATARCELLKPDGSPLRTITLDLPLGTHLTDIQYAEPSGQLLVTLANPDGSKPEVHFFGVNGKEQLNMSKGLEKMPIITLGGDGYLAVALAGGTVQIYNPTGQNIGEIHRTDGLPATQITLAPEGQWVAIGAVLAGQTEIPPRVLVFSREGANMLEVRTEALRLAPAGANGLLISSADGIRYVSLTTRNVVWTTSGIFDRALIVKGNAVIGGRMRDDKTGMVLSRILIVRLNDGTSLGGQVFNEDFREFRAILPPNDDGQVGVVTTNYTFRFPLPAEKP